MTQSAYTKRIGVLGGMGPESTLSFYELIIKQHVAAHENEAYPEIVIFSVNFDQILQYQNDADTAPYVQELSKGIEALNSASVDFIVIASNTVHKVLDELQQLSNVPILSIVDATLAQAHRRDLHKLLLIGTKQTMSGDFYKKASVRHNVQLVTPTLEEQDEINTIIFDDLNLGSIVPATSKKRMLEIISQYDVEGLILGCTELDMIIEPRDVTIPVLDTLQIHVDATLEEAKK